MTAIAPGVLNRFLLAALIAVVSAPAPGQDSVQLSGFAWVRGSSGGDDAPALETEDFSVQLQTGLDWYFRPRGQVHLQLAVRDGRDQSSGEQIGIVEGFVETSFLPRDRQLKLRLGSFFLPTSREHIDELWETPYSITPSALNGWLGEELRPIGVDLEKSMNSVRLGATLFRGNDAFGTLPAVRGWRLRNHVALIDETITADSESLSRITADTDDRLGWSARARWSSTRALLQYTFIDNRSTSANVGNVVPWRTPFHIVSAEYTAGDWTVAGEAGWGESWVPGLKPVTLTDLRAGYLMVSRRFDPGRLSLRLEEFAVDDDSERGVTAAWLWRPVARVRTALEFSAIDGELRAMMEIRAYFSIR